MKNLIIATLGLTSTAAMSLCIGLHLYDSARIAERDRLIVEMARVIEDYQHQHCVGADADNTRLKIPAQLAYAYEYDRDAAPLYQVALSEDLQEYTYAMCRVYDCVDYYPLMLAVMWKESDFDAAAQSSTGDYGLMQINECNHDTLREVLGVDDFLDPEDNIQSGVYLLSGLLKKYGDTHKALMAYNMGPGGAKKCWDRGIYKSNYSKDVLSKLDKILQK